MTLLHSARTCLIMICCLLAPAISQADEPAVIPGIAAAVNTAIDTHEVSGAVTLVATADGVVHVDAAGYADIASARPMTADAIFWIASMSKPVTGACVLMLQDDGKLHVDDPVSKYLPEFAGLRTKDNQPAEITISHLLTHTSGLAEINADQARGCLTLADAIPLYTAQPVNFVPGTKWVYCQSGINTAARVVEVVSGQSFPDFLAERLTGPLGMPDTTFYLTESQAQRLATSYRRTEGGTLEPAEIFILLGKSATSTDRFPAANGGLFSTAGDYARFCRMLLRGGELDGRRYLKAETVKLFAEPRTGDLRTGFTDGNAWGLGCAVVRQPQGVTQMLAPGTYGHGGAYGTQAWIDPVQKAAYVLMVQRANYPNADASELRRGFQAAAVKALK